jgi:hypothetical protein
MISESSASISRFRSPTALRGLSERNEFEQTSSAQSPVWWADVFTAGRISTRRTRWPRAASCQAHSEPASPAPMTVTEAMGPAIVSGRLEAE